MADLSQREKEALQRRADREHYDRKREGAERLTALEREANR